ncbi:hypothetical protein [Acidisphaera sp. S103]|uniref:hypothetical protein n=1 Tax=Acidisphaera sp. S103 TaxID=1747223 RepID=UPI00131AAEF6|nr:hypothetical protein [Acidisphaera sp. S103]
MSASGRQTDGMVNKGFIVNRPDAGAPGRGGRTFIVTGLHRSGTSLVASVLRQVGIFMGTEINDLVHEDEGIAKILMARDFASLTRLIRERDAAYGTWGFKFPMLAKPLKPADLARFSDPHIIVPFRDPVSIAVRKSLSEYQDSMRALRIAVEEQAAMVAFVEQLRCPSLLLSYEKSLVFPGDFIDAILQFCGLPRSDALRDRLVGLIEPNRQDYIAQVRRNYGGVIDGVSEGFLHGWCCLTAVVEPVALQLFVDDRPVLAFRADLFRQDLLDAGFGTGHHGFAIDLGKLQVRPDAVIRIRVAEQEIELDHSGRRLADYGG